MADEGIMRIVSATVHTGKKHAHRFMKAIGLELVALVVYFLLGIIFYTIEEEWGAGDAMYFSFVVMTTVGYGDLLPTSDGSKIFTSFYILFALAISSVALASVLNAIVMRAMQLKKSEEIGIFAKEKAMKRMRMKRFAGAFLAFLFTILIGTLIYALGMDWEGQGYEGDKWVNGLYFTVVTVTTVGFGDLSPLYDDGFKFFTILLMVVGIPVFGFSLATFTEVIFGEERDQVELNVIHGGMCMKKFEGLEEFSKAFAKVGAGNIDDDGGISRFEFLSFLLVKNGVIDMDTIAEAMDNFNKLDKDNSNSLNREDVLAQSRSLSKDRPGVISVKAEALKEAPAAWKDRAAWDYAENLR